MLQVIKDSFNLLTFRITREAMLNFGWQHFVFGLFWTWLVGVGRYWDNPRVGILQHLGIGSVVYIFALSLFLWLIISPLKPKDWTYFRVLTFVSMCSPPAVLYSIPVEFYTDLPTANTINAWFLLIVSVWRVSLLVFYLKRFADLKWLPTIAATVLPLNLIIVGLTFFNLEKVVFNIMGGMDTSSPNQTAYGVLILLTVASFFIFPAALAVYIVCITIAHKKINEPENREN
ncbi:MAG: hypothetical protein MUC29_05140 [Pyrinomonadaceae bacterium]|nr:hypothetical protein [Pyrinomonadaceae bacterium]